MWRIYNAISVEWIDQTSAWSSRSNLCLVNQGYCDTAIANNWSTINDFAWVPLKPMTNTPEAQSYQVQCQKLSWKCRPCSNAVPVMGIWNIIVCTAHFLVPLAITKADFTLMTSKGAQFNRYCNSTLRCATRQAQGSAQHTCLGIQCEVGVETLSLITHDHMTITRSCIRC